MINLPPSTGDFSIEIENLNLSAVNDTSSESNLISPNDLESIAFGSSYVPYA